MSSMLKKIQFRSGFNKNTTNYSAESNWVDGDKVRFRNGRPEKFGGWIRETVKHNTDATNELFTGVSRDVHAWVDLSFNKFLVSASHKKVELLFGGQVYDVSPYREELTLTDAITTTSGSSIVSIEDTNHNLSVDDFLFIDSQQTTLDGIDLLGEYQVVTVTDVNNYTIDTGTNASGTTAGGGGDLGINYLLEVGDVDNGNVTGYGGDTWNTPGADPTKGWGAERAGEGGTFLRQWSLDNWGEDLLACVRGGKIYQWDATSGIGSRLEVIANAPTENYIVLVSQPSRHLCTFGTQNSITGVFDPLNIRWPSQESLTDWAITSTNTAGEYRLPLGNYIVDVIQSKSEILIFTDNTVYSMRYVGGSSIFQFDIVGSNISAVSQHSGVDINGVVYWQGLDNYYMYDGSVSTLECSLDEYVFDQDGEGRLNFAQKEKTFCGTNKEFNEIIWLYPSKNSTEIDRYVIYNYLERVWYDGTHDRTTWVDRGVFERAYALSSGGVLFLHEEGKDDDGAGMSAFIESGDLDIEDGLNFMFVDRFIPDFKLIPNRNAELSLTFKDYPSSTGTVKGPYSFNNDTRQINLRGRGRHMSIKYATAAIGADFEVGAPRFGFQPDGER